jgi:hypothetical protein
VLLVETELGLYRSAVNAETVETLAGTSSQFHVLFTTVGVNGERNLEMHACNELGVRELPDVDMMAGNNARKSFDILSDLGNADMLGGGLQKNSRSASGKRNTCLEDDSCNEQGDGRVGVDLARPIGEPDDKSCNHDTNVAKHISNDMKDHGVHTHIGVVVSMAILLASLLGKGVVVTVVNARVPSRSSRVGVRTVPVVANR